MTPSAIRAVFEAANPLRIQTLLERATPIQAFALGHLDRAKVWKKPPGGWAMAAMQCLTWSDYLEFRRQLEEATI